MTRFQSDGRKTPTYQSWLCMRSRCNRKTDHNYPHYGGRGIRVCKRWESFDLFVEDMGLRPAGKTLDREDSNRDYSPSNCKWSSLSEQNRNRRALAREDDGRFKPTSGRFTGQKAALRKGA